MRTSEAGPDTLIPGLTGLTGQLCGSLLRFLSLPFMDMGWSIHLLWVSAQETVKKIKKGEEEKEKGRTAEGGKTEEKKWRRKGEERSGLID